MIIIQGHLRSQLSLRLMGPVGEEYRSESDEDALQEEDGNGGWESTWQYQACFALKKFRFPRRHCGCGKQTFQGKGLAWAKPCFPNIVYKIEDILVIRTLYCVNKELESRKWEAGLAFPFWHTLLWRWDGQLNGTGQPQRCLPTVHLTAE